MGKKNILLFFTALILLFIVPALYYGQEVAPNGSFTYSYPINTPPGTNGMEPNLSLVYNSSMGNGILGMGWSLGGLSVIVRDPSYGINFNENDHYIYNGQKLIYSDPATGGDGYYHTERESHVRIKAYNLNTPASYWIVGLKNGTKLFFGYNSLDHTAATDGHIDAEGKGGSARLWALSMVEDVHGNYYTVEYFEDSGNGGYYPTRIIYTKNVYPNDLVKYRSVEFLYIWRDDRGVKYMPTKVEMNRLIDEIVVKVGVDRSGTGGELLRKYKLSYGYGSSTGRGRLMSIQEYGDDGVSALPATTFEWQEGQMGWEFVAGYTNTLPEDLFFASSDAQNVNHNMGTTIVIKQAGLVHPSTNSSKPKTVEPADHNMGQQLADINGDGLADFIQLYLPGNGYYGNNPMRRVLINTGNGWELSAGYTNTLPDVPFFAGTDASNKDHDMGTRLADINGDGLADLIQLYLPANGYYGSSPIRKVYLNTGSGWELGGEYTNTLPDVPFFTGTDADNIDHDMGTRLADINGDGLVDLIQLYLPANGYYGSSPIRKVYLNTGSGWELGGGYTNTLPDVPFFTGTDASNKDHDMGTRLADINGDGLVDLIQLYLPANGYYGSSPIRKVYLNTGSGWELGGEYTNTLPDVPFFTGTDADNIDHDMGTRLADINGDGLVDLIQLYLPANGYYGSSPIRKVYLNTGSGWELGGEYTNTLPDVPFFTGTDASNKDHDMGTRLADINGDGLVDLIQLYLPENGYYGSSPIRKVYLNTGSGWELGGEYTNTLPDVPFFTGTDASNKDHDMGTRLADINGDGRVDLIQLYLPENGYYDNIPQRVVCVSTPSNFDRLTTIHNRNGGTTSVTYTPAPQVNGAIQPSSSSYPIIANKSTRNLVTRITFNDGLGLESSSTYEYHNGLTHSGYSHEKADLGFEWIRKGNKTSTDATINITETYYIQEKPYHGLVEKKVTLDPSGNRYKEVHYTYKNRPHPNCPDAKFIYKEDEYTYLYNFDEGAQSDIYRVQYAFYNASNELTSYDEYGNHLKRVDYGRVTGEGGYDDVRVETEYAYNIDINTNTYVMAPMKVSSYRRSLDDIEGLASEVRYYYDNLSYGQIDKGLLTRKEHENGADDVATTYGYDNYGNLIWVKDGRVNSGEYTGNTSEIEYDSEYRTWVKKRRDAKGYEVTTNYDGLMRPVEAEDENGVVWYSEYDEFGRVKATIAPGDDAVNPTRRTIYSDVESPNDYPRWMREERKESETSYLIGYSYYDGFGRVIQEKHPTENVNEWVTVDYYYDEMGKKWKSSVPYITSTSGWTQRDTTQKAVYKEYDAVGRVIRAVNTDGTFTETEYGKRSTTYSDELKHVTVKRVDDNDGRIRHEEVYKGEAPNPILYSKTTIKEAWDGTRITDERGNVLTTELDMLGRKERYDDPDMGIWSYTYDANGNLKTQTDAKGQTIGFEYDKLNRVVKKDYPSGVDIIYMYDEGGAIAHAIGRLTSVSYEGGMESYSYDERGRVETVTRTIEGKSKTLGTGYDSMDRVVALTYPDGEVVNHTYNGGGELETLEGVSTDTYITNIDYTALGKIGSMTYGNGITTNYDYYDTAGENDPCAGTSFSYRLKAISAAPGSILNLEYEYDKVDNIKVKRDLNSSFYTEEYMYDELNRLISANAGMYGNKIYEYDEINNIVQKDGRSYIYSSSKPHAVVDDGTYTYTYDANGNMETRSDGRTISYDYDNRVISLSDGGSFGYDANGSRIKKYEGGITTYYFFPQYEEEYPDGVSTPMVTKHYFGNGQRVAQRSTGGLLYYHTDHLGSSVRITNGVGELVSVHRYTPYGSEIEVEIPPGTPENLLIDNVTINTTEDYKALDTITVGSSVTIESQGDATVTAGKRVVIKAGFKVKTGATVHIGINPGLGEPKLGGEIHYLFTGKEKDGSGLYYYGARYYDPELGRFISADTRLDGLNRYTYCGNNPVKYVDPTGHGKEEREQRRQERQERREQRRQERQERREAKKAKKEGASGNETIEGGEETIEVPKAPPGVDIDENIKEAEEMSYPEWVNKVKEKGEWDYKQQGREYEDFGNFNYGATGKAKGFSNKTLKKAAGAVQKLQKQSKKEWGSPSEGPPYGDDPNDQEMIERGADYYDRNYSSKSTDMAFDMYPGML